MPSTAAASIHCEAPPSKVIGLWLLVGYWPMIRSVISLKACMDAQLEVLLNSVLDCYRSALTAISKSGFEAYPPLGEHLQATLFRLRDQVSTSATPSTVEETEQKVEAELREWSQLVSEHLKQKTAEVKEIIMVVAKTAQSAGDRGERYVSHLNNLTARLQATANLEQLGEIRQSILKSADELRSCAKTIEEDGREAVSQLRSQLKVYETRLQEVERLVSRDALTGIDNRRELEAQIAYRIGERRTFSVAMLDLMGFKKINDVHGHVAGDELLRKFAAELRSRFRATDVVGRWGGDEFVIIVDCELNEAKARIDGLSQWICGKYTVMVGSETRFVRVAAAVGVAGWQLGETLPELVRRADAAMYQEKARLSL
jgi:diguanylate cyclase (GGDEF)-like protein